MPELGELRKGREIGYTSGSKFIWAACEICGKERWVHSLNKICQHCNALTASKSDKARRKISQARIGKYGGEKCPAWRGGRRKDKDGYIKVWISPDDFYHPLAAYKNSVLEHRLVVAKALGRLLQPWEIVHHKGDKYPRGSVEDKGDNRYPENLELTTKGNHTQEHSKGYRDGYQKGYYDGRDKRIKDLEMEINDLKHSSG